MATCANPPLSSRPANPVERIDGVRRGMFSAAVAAFAVPGAAMAAVPANPFAMLPRAQLALMLRGLADLEHRADGTLSREGTEMLGRITEVMPEAPLLIELHRVYPGARRSEVWQRDMPVDLDLLHAACHSAQAISFGYTDLRGNRTMRQVLPLELVHPPHGILLFAWCELREAPRKFFVHAMQDLQVNGGDFSDLRVALLTEAVAEEHARRWDC